MVPSRILFRCATAGTPVLACLHGLSPEMPGCCHFRGPLTGLSTWGGSSALLTLTVCSLGTQRLSCSVHLRAFVRGPVRWDAGARPGQLCPSWVRRALPSAWNARGTSGAWWATSHPGKGRTLPPSGSRWKGGWTCSVVFCTRFPPLPKLAERVGDLQCRRGSGSSVLVCVCEGARARQSPAQTLEPSHTVWDGMCCSFEINKDISWKLVMVCLNLNHLVDLGTCPRCAVTQDPVATLLVKSPGRPDEDGPRSRGSAQAWGAALERARRERECAGAGPPVLPRPSHGRCCCSRSTASVPAALGPRLGQVK